MVLRAKLDPDLIYWGAEEVAALGPDDVAAPDEAIRPGAYRWQLPQKDARGAVVDVGHWMPLPPNQVKAVQTAPSLEQAFAELLEGHPALGPRAQAWLGHYKQTIDSLGEK